MPRPPCASEAEYRTLFETMDEGFALCELVRDPGGRVVDYRYVELNPALVRHGGLSPDALRGRRATDVFPDLDPWLIETYARVVDEGNPVSTEHHFVHVDRWLRINAFPRGGDRFAVLYSDVSDRKRAEEAIRASEERQAFLLELSDALRPLADPVNVQEAVTRVALRHFDADRCYYCEIVDDEAIIRRDAARSDLPSVAGTYALGSMPLFRAVVEAGRPFVVPDVRTTDLVDESLRALCVELSVVSFIDVPVIKDGRPVGIFCVVQSHPRTWTTVEAELAEEVAERTWAAVERARAAEVLRESEAALQRRVAEATGELRTLSRRLLTVQEEERRHLARELHDEIGQVLTGLGLQLGASPQVAGRRLDDVRHTVRELTEQVRQLSMDLRPAALDAYGLLPALAWLVERYQKRTGVAVTLLHEGLGRRFPAPVEITAYRLVQEALTNVARHAGVDAAGVQLFADDEALLVSVSDEGRGFVADERAAGSGLHGMRERVELLGGTLTVDAAPGRGVSVTADLPLRDPEPDDSGADEVGAP